MKRPKSLAFLYKCKLKEKQKLRDEYNIKLYQLKSLYKNKRFFDILESRLYVCLYRANISITLKHARQLVLHKFIYVNGRLINKSNYLLKTGDIVTYRSPLVDSGIIKNSKTVLHNIKASSFVYLKSKEMFCNNNINKQLIFEFLNK